MNWHRLTLTALTAATLAGASDVRAQQDGAIAFPNVYQIQFENDWVRLIHVSIPANGHKKTYQTRGK